MIDTEKKPLIILTGPTAVGKTRASIGLAKAIGGEIISADSMQVYRHMDIGSAKITKEEMADVPHYLIDVLEPEEEFHVVRFQQMAKAAMQIFIPEAKYQLLSVEPDFTSRHFYMTLISLKMKETVYIERSWRHLQRKKEPHISMDNLPWSTRNQQKKSMRII